MHSCEDFVDDGLCPAAPGAQCAAGDANLGPPREHAIYVITNLANGKKYVGQSTRPDRRWQRHLLKGSTCVALKRALKKYGKDSFKFTVMAVGFSKSEADGAERHLISALGTLGDGGYNLTGGGEGCLGQKFSDDTRRRMSIAKTGRNHSQEHKDKIAAGTRRAWADPTKRKNAIAGLERAWANPDKRILMLANRKPQTAEQCAAMSSRSKALWQDTEYRQRQVAFLNSPESIRKRGETIKKLYSTPEARARLSATGRRVMAERMKNPEERERIVEMGKRNIGIIRHDISDETRRKLSEASKNRWADPAWRQFIISRRRNINREVHAP